MTRTPECDKMLAVKLESQAIGSFLDWLSEQGMFISEYTKVEGYRDEQPWPVSKSIEQWLADYFEIDLAKVEKERRAILEDFRKAQGIPAEGSQP